MKNILSTLILFLSLNIGFGQKEYDELRILYADGSYEKLAKAAEKYTNSDNTKKDVWPYIWLAKGLYKIHLKGDADPVFKNAYKDAINALSKAMKFDKTGSVMGEEDNAEFLDEIQGSLVEQIENEISGGNYRKAFSWVNSYKKVSANLTGQMLLEGVCKFKTDDKTTAFSLWKTVDGQLKSITSIDSWSDGDKRMLRLGATQTAECYVSIKKVEDARNILNKVAQWFEDDDDFKQTYNEIVN